MFQLTTYAQQLADRAYDIVKPSPTPAICLLSKLGYRPPFTKIKSRKAEYGELIFGDDEAYVGLDLCDYPEILGSEYLVLLRAIWVPPAKRGRGISTQVLKSLAELTLEESSCSLLAITRPFFYNKGNSPFEETPRPSHFQYDQRKDACIPINSAFTRAGFSRFAIDDLASFLGWGDYQEIHPASSGFLLPSRKSTWFLYRFYDALNVPRP